MISIGLSGGCIDDDSDNQTLLRGWAFAAKPVTDASLSIYDLAGDLIYCSDQPVTSDFGSFLINIDREIPSEFRVVCTPSPDDDQLFGADLMTDIANYDSQSPSVYINLATTLVSRYLDKHAGKTLAEAEETAKAYLQIPDYVDIGSGLYGHEEYFSHRAFLMEAAQNGGADAFIDHLVAQMQTPEAITHPFTKQPGLVSIGGGAGAYVADALLKGAISYAGGHVLGWALSQAGLGNIFGGDSGLSDAIANMQQTLTQIQSQINNLSNQLNNVQNKLITVSHYSEYNLRAGQLNNVVTAVQTLQADIANLAASESNSSADMDTLKNSKADIIRRIQINDLLTKRNLIHNQLTGNAAGQKSLLKLWSQCVSDSHRFLSAADYQQIQTVFDYWDTIQLAILEINVEYLHDQNITSPSVSDLVSEYQSNRNIQLAALPAQVPEGVFLDTQTGKMWLQKPVFNQNGATYKTESGPMMYVYGKLPDDPSIANPESTMNQNNLVNHGFHDWILPTPADLNALMKGYTGSNATEEWFVKNGAFPQGSTLKSIWDDTWSGGGDSGGNVWTGEWYWDKRLAREVVNLKCIGVGGPTGGTETIVAILNEGAAQIGSVFPVRTITADEHYFWPEN